MTPIILEQKVRKRRKRKKASSFSHKSLFSSSNITSRIPLKLTALGRSACRYLKTVHWRSPLGILICSLVLLLVAAGVFAVCYGHGRDIALPEDPVLHETLLGAVSSEFSGQGSGDIAAEVDLRFITGVDPVSYVIQPGDTLSEIAHAYDITVGTLIGYNDIENVRMLIPGEVLKIPEIDGIPYRVKPGDTLDSIAQTYKTSVNRLLDTNDLASNLIQPGDELFIPGGQISEYEYRKATGTLFLYPTQGRLSSGYGYRRDPFTGQRRFHYGIDIANRIGTPITSAMAGVIADVGEQPLGYGKYVIIRHSYGFQSLYGHLDKVYVREGQRIGQGTVLGEMGNTGRSTGSHLHFSIYKNSSPINPLNYLF